MCDELYWCMHGIDETAVDTLDHVVNLDRCVGVAPDAVLARSTRVSLTIRHVPKVGFACGAVRCDALPAVKMPAIRLGKGR